MKRLLIAIATAFAFAAFAAAAATAAPAATIHVTPAAPTTADTITLTTDVSDVDGAYVGVFSMDNATCDPETWTEDNAALLDEGPATDGSFVTTTPELTAGAHTFVAIVLDANDEYAADACTTVTVTAPPEVPAVPTVPSDLAASSYLCWNREMVDPVAYVDRTADAMWKTGNYFEPQAILGNVAGGTNLGAYHLVCNAPATMHQTDLGLGGSGEVYSAEAMAAYHAEHAGGNDLNVYHIWK